MRLLICQGIAALAVFLLAGQVQESPDALSGPQALKLLAEIYDYESFRDFYPGLKDADKIMTRENYEKFLAFIAPKYQAEFSESELKEIVSFLNSPTGKKWSRFIKEEQLLSGFLLSIVEPEDPPQIWTCRVHTNIRTPNPGNCPICERILIEK